jgi:fructose-1,6-bisphosphatase/inositol monophosphatase family enzyme
MLGSSGLNMAYVAAGRLDAVLEEGAQPPRPPGLCVCLCLGLAGLWSLCNGCSLLWRNRLTGVIELRWVP